MEQVYETIENVTYRQFGKKRSDTCLDCGAPMVKLARLAENGKPAAGRATCCSNPGCFAYLTLPVKNWKEL